MEYLFMFLLDFTGLAWPRIQHDGLRWYANDGNRTRTRTSAQAHRSSQPASSASTQSRRAASSAVVKYYMVSEIT